MTFPETFEEFAEQYKIVDSKEVYTNGTELIPIFRVKQWLEHQDALKGANQMHEILFRGKTADGKWVKGAYVSQNWYPSDDEFDMKGIVVDESNIICYDEDCLWYRVIPETVGQFTGAKDKNGTKLFEGDIVKTDEGVYLCVWDEYNFEYMFRNEHEEIGIVCVSWLDFEIIGNIHDNPELLKGSVEDA